MLIYQSDINRLKIFVQQREETRRNHKRGLTTRMIRPGRVSDIMKPIQNGSPFTSGTQIVLSEAGLSPGAELVVRMLELRYILVLSFKAYKRKCFRTVGAQRGLFWTSTMSAECQHFPQVYQYLHTTYCTKHMLHCTMVPWSSLCADSH